MDSVRVIILTAFVAECFLVIGSSSLPPTSRLPALCRARGCRYIQKCDTGKCPVMSANLRCIPRGVDMACRRSRKYALLVGDPKNSHNMKPKRCGKDQPSCPSGSSCLRGVCCYSNTRRQLRGIMRRRGHQRRPRTCRRNPCRKRCWDGYVCLSLRTRRCGMTYTCVPKDKPGFCPRYPFGATASCLAGGQSNCGSDSACPGNTKCCENLCHEHRCAPPTFDKEGSCPDLDKNIFCAPGFPGVVHRCKTDLDCEGAEKCCSTECGGRRCKGPKSCVVDLRG